MKKIILFILFVSLFVFAACSSSQIQGEVTSVPAKATVQEEVATGGCPRGIHNDAYPGMCPLYTDKNDNGLCDLGE